MGSSNSSFYSNDYINDSMNSISSYVNSSNDSYNSDNSNTTNYSETLSSEEVDNDCINVLLESGLNHYVKDKCCLRKNQTYDLFATIEKKRSYYNYYMKACCYANLTEDFNYLNCVKEKGLFPFNIGMIDIVKLNSAKEVYDFKKNNFRVFKVPYKKDNDILNVEVKFSKTPYIGVNVD
jgi:hypothetical protein